MTAAKQQLELNALVSAFDTHLQASGWGVISFNSGFEVGDQIKPPLIAIHFLPNGPEPFQMGDTVQKYYQRVLQLDMYMETEGRALAIIDTMMDYIDLMAVSVTDPLAGNALVGSIACYNTDSIYGEIAPPNLLNPKVIRWRAITRATLESFYPNG